MAQAMKAAKPSLPSRFTRYIKDVMAEMKRVVWPSRTEVVNSSGIVIVTLLFFIVFTLLVDQAATLVINALNNIRG